MSMLKEFKDFALKGNVVDMAVGIIIGAAFTPIVKSLVGDIIMPPIGLLLGGIDFSDLKIPLQEASVAADGTEMAAVAISYGNFINICITFTITAFAVFMLVKGMNSMKKKEAAAAPSTKDCSHCLMSIPISATKCGHCTSGV